jgi:putative oxidoreductase
MMSILNNHSVGLLIMRLMVGGLMLFHGVAKITHPGSVEFIGGTLSNAGLPSLLAYGVYVGEVVAPLMIIVGIFSRYAALVIVINMVFAVFLMHTGDVFMLTEHGGWRLELQAFYLLGALAIALVGSGRFAIKPD